MTIVAATSQLASLDQLKTELEITTVGTQKDAYLTGIIMSMSSAIETYLDRTLGTAAFVQTKNYTNADRLPNKIFLVKYPTSAVSELSYTWSDGVTTEVLDSEEYFFESDEGILTLTSTGRQTLVDGLYAARAAATGSGYITLSVTHTGGYDLPEDTDTAVMDLPEVISRACIDLSKNTYYTRTQNSTVKSETVPDVLSQTFFQSQGGSTGGGDGFVQGALNSLDSYLDLRQVF